MSSPSPCCNQPGITVGVLAPHDGSLVPPGAPDSVLDGWIRRDDDLGDLHDLRHEIPQLLDTLRREVAGPHPSTLERLLADRVAIGWLALTLAEGTYYQALERGLNPADEAVYLKRVDRAQRRYLAAIKTLAQVRRMGLPTLQVNIGEKQVNVSGG